MKVEFCMIYGVMTKSFSNLPQLFSNAYRWLYRSRKNNPQDSDIWSLKSSWHSQAEAILESFKTSTYQFDVQIKMILSCGETIALWSSKDALIIKVLTGIIQEQLKPLILKTCTISTVSEWFGLAKVDGLQISILQEYKTMDILISKDYITRLAIPMNISRFYLNFLNEN